MPYEEYEPDHYIQPLKPGQPVYLCDIDGTLTWRHPEHLEFSNTRGIHEYHRVSEDLYHPDVFNTVGPSNKAERRSSSCRDGRSRVVRTPWRG